MGSCAGRTDPISNEREERGVEGNKERWRWRGGREGKGEVIARYERWKEWRQKGRYRGRREEDKMRGRDRERGRGYGGEEDRDREGQTMNSGKRSQDI